MSEPLKYMYNPEFFEKLCPVMCQTIPDFDCQYFIHRVFDNRWPDLELKQRVAHIATVLHDFLPKDFSRAVRIVMTLSRELRDRNFAVQGFHLIFLPEYVMRYGLDHPDLSLEALNEITKLASAEFAIRPFLIRYPELTMKRMLEWSFDTDENVRRLSSEGCRPRLPWAMGVPSLKKDPSPILQILENLKNDPALYVRKSVANNINDIAKDHPQKIKKLARAWKGKSAETDWILKHGCRTLLKKGDKDVLHLHGFDPSGRAALSAFNMSRQRIRIGERVDLDIHIASREKIDKKFRIEYAIDFLTSTGKRSRKVFQVAERKLAPGEGINLKRTQSFKDLTTRKHFKGKHEISILVNGKKLGSREFLLC